ncbi:pentapeptide repeat-containing protein [Sphingobacterium alkalisoli]|uniref:Pentapeptide repeat-containing protein n=1 Tax=Sphingobacterium alkalisoli TaxID=1874115 RepID=A0A4U0H415_9SPHI|nr:pentapeptide repeat-containing protein [Sphingobacterium alkalisoli]TJY66437.1 pentapeptide repeat-containing protein [Sphingobacterium alkalisoli]GGH16421.1 hypothetical protein GCM10011418_18770 [Sphingobacterium alkalisoli]
MTKKYLIERWEVEPQLRFILNKINDLLKGGNVQSRINTYEFVDGKLDLRGIIINERTIAKLELQNADLTFSSFKDCWIENSLFEKCNFEKVDFSKFSDHKNIFKECYFKNCKFNYASLGDGGTSFSECVFEDCNFFKTIFIRPEFVGVSFKNCKINSIDFFGSSFESCCFEGNLKDIWFRGGFPLQVDYSNYGIPKRNEMKNVSFVNAELEDLTFSDNCDLSSVKIKSSDKYYKYERWKERLEFLKMEDRNWSDKEKKEAEIFANTYLVHAKNQEWHIINREDVERDHGKDIALKIINHLNNFQ